jgi:hypothetical protein
LNDIGAAIPGCAKITKLAEHAATTISRREYENAMVRLLGSWPPLMHGSLALNSRSASPASRLMVPPEHPNMHQQILTNRPQDAKNAVTHAAFKRVAHAKPAN